MPEKQPDVYNIIWAGICQYVSQHQTLLTGMFFTGIIAFLRKMSDQESDTFWGILCEVMTCVFFVGALFEVLDELNIHQDWFKLIAVGIGVYGVILIRMFSDFWISKITGKSPSNKEE